MEEKRSPIQIYNLFKSFVAMFMIQAVIIMFTPQQVVAPIWYQILAVNFVVAGVLGWYLYKHWYHMVFSYDDAGFRLQKGNNTPIDHSWKEFSRVSLARGEYGEYTVRLYSDDQPTEIPVSKLRLEPFQFRLRVIDLVAKATESS